MYENTREFYRLAIQGDGAPRKKGTRVGQTALIAESLCPEQPDWLAPEGRQAVEQSSRPSGIVRIRWNESEMAPLGTETAPIGGHGQP
ncbi:MAG: hypothetical protein JO099_20885 [Acidobacteriia bacterium]|nr:hypothetical protein [Terriglobia bacterium]